MDQHFIDIYCERTDAGLWAEPWNAFSNISFIIAAALAALLLARRGGADGWEIALIVLGGLIGVGSFLFHIFPYPWAELADVIPIWSFVALFVVVAIYRSTGHHILRTLRILVIAGTIAGAVFYFTSGDIRTEADNAVGPLNGALQYAPALIALLVFAALTHVKRHPARFLIAGAAAAFLLALAFRSVDLMACPVWPRGSHFLWHGLNGVMIGCLLAALVLYLPPPRRKQA